MVRAHSDPRRWSEVADLFDRALVMPPAERDGFLATACAGDFELLSQLRELVAAHERTGMLDELSERLASDVDAALPLSPDPGSHIGNYRIVRTLGSGGQGVVFLAEREGEGFQQHVAIKVLRVGIASNRRALVRRFLSERSILARLDHPNIPRFLDGGLTAAGEPFFAMEYVRGTPVDRYCDEQRLSTRQRLSLFVSVCDAMRYAHQHLVVHRDLKPSNILISGDGVVKVLDFGIAKLLDAPHDESGLTGAGQRWMTPHYASPEQVRGDAVTTAADVFALGVVLYELLACTRPHAGKSDHEVEHAILEVEPMRPSVAVAAAAAICESRGMSIGALKRELVGDLDTIILKALSKAPERRYSTAGELADDIRRYLAGLPVHARADSFAYRARKFVSRHSLLVGALSFGVLSILTGGIATLVAARRATRSAAEAESERERAEQVSGFAVGLFRAADPLRAGTAEVSARELLDSGAARLRRELIDQPARRASMLEVLAQSYAGLGQYLEAYSASAEAIALHRAQQPQRPAQLAGVLELHARILMARGMPDTAAAFAREALALRRRSGAPTAELAASMSILGDYFHTGANLDSAEHYFRTVLAELDATRGKDSSSYADMLLSLATVLTRKGRLAESESLQIKALALRRATLPAGHPKIASALSGLATSRFALGKVSQARADLQAVLDLRIKALGPSHPEAANALHQLAFVAELEGAAGDSIVAWYRKAAAIKEQALGPNHLSLARTFAALGTLHLRRGEYAPAESLLTRVVEIRRAAFGDGNVDVARARNAVAVLYRHTRRARVAEGMHRRALDVLRPKLGDDSPEVLLVELDLGATLMQLGRDDEAEKLVTRAGELLARSAAWMDKRRARQADSLLAVLRDRRARSRQR